MGFRGQDTLLKLAAVSSQIEVRKSRETDIEISYESSFPPLLTFPERVLSFVCYHHSHRRPFIHLLPGDLWLVAHLNFSSFFTSSLTSVNPSPSLERSPSSTISTLSVAPGKWTCIVHHNCALGHAADAECPITDYYERLRISPIFEFVYPNRRIGMC